MKHNQLIKHFSPMWFAVSMGIGGFANLLYQLGNQVDFLKAIAIILAVSNLLLFIIMFIPWILRWFRHYDKLNEDMNHPISSNFFVTMPVALMIIGTHLLLMGMQYVGVQVSMTIALIIWIIGVLLALGFSVLTTFNMMKQESIHPQMSNFSWFISPVASIIVPLLGNSLVKYFYTINVELASFINIIDIAFFGIGFILFIILTSIVMNRFLFHKMPNAMVLPSFWIILGPIGVGTISLMGLADANVTIGLLQSVQILNFIAIILWGFGIWALTLVLAITAMYFKAGKIPFSISWWAFIFPLASFSLSTLGIYNYTHVLVLKYFAIVLTVLLTGLFIITFVYTLIGVINKNLLYPKQQS